MRKVKIYAYSFQSDLTLEAMLARLTEEGSRPWYVGDNDNWGEYLWARPIPAPYRGSLKIIAEPDHFVVNVKILLEEEDVQDVKDMQGAEAQFAAFRELLFSRLLPAIGAHSLAPTDDYD